jgi:hypothetical protein
LGIARIRDFVRPPRAGDSDPGIWSAFCLLLALVWILDRTRLRCCGMRCRLPLIAPEEEAGETWGQVIPASTPASRKDESEAQKNGGLATAITLSISMFRSRGSRITSGAQAVLL